MMTADEKDELEAWCRYARVDDTADNGICDFTLKFMIRDVRMDAVMNRLSHEDACDVASRITEAVCHGCVDCYDDWSDPDEEFFTLDMRLEDGYIVMEGRYRT